MPSSGHNEEWLDPEPMRVLVKQYRSSFVWWEQEEQKLTADSGSAFFSSVMLKPEWMTKADLFLGFDLLLKLPIFFNGLVCVIPEVHHVNYSAELCEN